MTNGVSVGDQKQYSTSIFTDQEEGRQKMDEIIYGSYPELSFRQLESLSRACVQGFTPEHVKTFFNLLKPEMQKINYNPNKIFNVDETVISTIQYKVRKILTLKGKRKVHKLASAERSALLFNSIG